VQPATGDCMVILFTTNYIASPSPGDCIVQSSARDCIAQLFPKDCIAIPLGLP
jgi:hypothetical protein